MKKPFVKYNHATIQSTMSKDKSKFLAISNSISSMKTFFSIIVAMLVLLAPAAFAKRGEPAEVKPVVHEGIEYRAPHSTIASEKMGVVEAWDKATDKMLWEKKVYTVKINPLMERDVQDVFITKLEIDAGKLIVTNEKDARYSIDLKTQKVREYVTRVGYLPEFVLQHPIMAPMSTHDQFYFDIGEKPGSFNQIIVVYPKDMKILPEEGRKIELKGLESSFSLGGKRGTKEGYGNRLLDLRSWKYVD